jgi:hypothetical protein
MQRSLALGRLDQAARAADMLRFLSPDNALAWGVTAWQRMEDGNRAEALDYIVRSLALRPDDPPLLDLAGRLYAWHDCDPSAPALSDSAGQKMAQLRDSLMTRPAFQDAFSEVRAAWAARNQFTPASPAGEPQRAPGPILAGTGLGSRKIPTFALAAFVTSQTALQPISLAGERIAAGQARPPGAVYASPFEAGQGQIPSGPARSAGLSVASSSGGGSYGSYGSDMGTMFPPGSRFLPTYGGFTGGRPADSASLQPYLTYPSKGRMVMRYR